MTENSLQERAFDALNRQTKMKLKEKSSLLSAFISTNLSVLTKTDASDKLKDIQKVLKNSTKRSWDQDCTADKLSQVYGAWKEHKDAPGQKTCGRRIPESGGLNYLFRLEKELDGLIAEFDSEQEMQEKLQIGSSTLPIGFRMNMIGMRQSRKLNHVLILLVNIILQLPSKVEKKLLLLIARILKNMKRRCGLTIDCLQLRRRGGGSLQRKRVRHKQLLVTAIK